MSSPANLIIMIESGDRDAISAYFADQSARECDGGAALVRAAQHGDLSIVSLLLALGVSVEGDADGQDRYPILGASFFGRTDVVEYLCAHGADVEAASPAGERALYLAASEGRAAAAAVLISHEAMIDAANARGVTPLAMAARNGHTDVVKLLLAAGADRRKMDADGRTPADRARTLKRDECVRLLTEG